jgi:hypothetical protein
MNLKEQSAGDCFAQNPEADSRVERSSLKVISRESMIGPSFTLRAGPARAITRFPTSE